MFDIGFSELLIFGAIALIVLGPEKLPQAARTAGRYYAKFRRTVSNLQREIEAELDLAETRKQMQAELAKIKQAEADMKREMDALRNSLSDLQQDQSRRLAETLNPKTAQPEPASQPVSLSKPDADKSDSDAPTAPNFTSNPHAADVSAEFCTDRTRPMTNRWFLISDYERNLRLPPAPRLPNRRALPLMNAQPTHTAQQG